MSTCRKYTIKKTEVVPIVTLTEKELAITITQLINMEIEKLKKLSPHFEGSHVNLIGSKLVIVDELGLLSSSQNDIEAVLQAYGYHLETKRSDYQKGQILRLSDSILDMLSLLSKDNRLLRDNINEILRLDDTLISDSFNLDFSVQPAIKELNQVFQNQFLRQIIAALHQKTTINANQTTIIEKYTNSKQSRVIGVQFDDKDYRNAHELLKTSLKQINDQHLMNLVEGATKSIELRARKMGYVVKKVIKENQTVELVLVRRG